VKQIHAEFTEEVEKFTSLEYEIMDIEQRQFDDDFFQFRCRIKELERRLASVLTQGFDDCDTIIAKFKLLDSFEGLLNRAIIQDELEKKHITLLELYKQDLKTVQSVFLEGKALIEKNDERAPISINMPPIAGSLDWTRGLLERISEPMDRLSQLSQAIREREEYKDVQKLYHSLCKHLKEFEDFKIKQWEASVEENTEEKLNQFLLVKEESDTIPEGILSVNFDPVLVRLLREVKYLLLQDVEVPERAQKLYEKVDIYRTQSGNLDLIINMYNEILATLLPVEKPLLFDRIKSMNECLQPGIDTLRWNSDTIDQFISSCMSLVTEVDELVKKMKENIRQMIEKMKKWEKPLFERKNKPSQPDDLEQVHSAAVMGRHEDIRQDSKEILRLMKETTDAIRPDKKSMEWLAYVDYVNTLIIEGITRGINASMLGLADNINIETNKTNGKAAIFYVSVSLIDREVVFDPLIRSTGSSLTERGSGVRDIINRIIEGFIDISIQVTRIDTGNGDYLVEIKDQFDLLGSLQCISSHMDEMEKETDAFIDRYQSFKFLWEETLEENFTAFLETGTDPRKLKHTKKNEDGDEEEDESFEWMAAKILDGVHTQKPSLEEFDKRITHYHKVKEQISAMSTSTTIGWLTVNSQPLQQKLNTIVEEWIKRYTGFLMENTIKEINNIKKFISNVSEGIKTIPEKAESKAEKDTLMTVMTHLRDVKMIKDRAAAEINPMKEMIQLLKKHQVNMQEDFLVVLEESKTSLNEVSEYALSSVKENILPLQTLESKNIKEQLSSFTKKVEAFRAEFLKSCPYNIENSTPEIIDQAYETIADYYQKTRALDDEAKDLNNLETLFDIQKSTYRPLRDCKNELGSLKYMWDLIALIDMQFSSWKKTLWDKIDTEGLTQLIKDMQTKQTNPGQPQNKEVRNWKAFQALNERVKNMNAILPLIS
jgi:dynein heavy chain